MKFELICLTHAALALAAFTVVAPAQTQGPGEGAQRPPRTESSPRAERSASDPAPPLGPGGPRPGGPGRGGFGGVREDMKVVRSFDKDGDKRLNAAERRAAREFIAQERAQGRGGRPGGFGRRGGDEEPAGPGPKLTPADVKAFPNATSRKIRGSFTPLTPSPKASQRKSRSKAFEAAAGA